MECSTAGDNFDQLEAIAGIKSARGKLRWRQGLAVVFYNNTSGTEFLRYEKMMD